MASFLGPETPRPFSVISESYQRRLRIPELPILDRYSFGDVYENRMCELINRYLELGTHERLCYVGEEKATICPLIERHFCLIEPVTTIVPGHIHYQETASKKAMVKVPIANVGAEEFFAKQAQEAKYKGPNRYFDKVLLKEANHMFEDPKQAYKNIMESVSEYGKILIIYRPGPMNTLPYPRDACKKVSDNEQNYTNIILDLQSCGFDVQWDIETLPIVMPKVKWYAMMREKYPPQMAVMSNFEVACGLRELSEGIMKYEGEIVEFCDRLLFVTACRSLMQTGYPSIQRYGGKGENSFKGLHELKYQLKVTPEMAKYVPKKQ